MNNIDQMCKKIRNKQNYMLNLSQNTSDYNMNHFEHFNRKIK